MTLYKEFMDPRFIDPQIQLKKIIDPSLKQSTFIKKTCFMYCF